MRQSLRKHSSSRATPAPPSVTYDAFQRALGLFKTGGLPGRIDRSVLAHRFGPGSGALVEACKFLGLADENGNTTETAKTLLEAFESSGWPEVLAEVLRRAYAPILEIDLSNATLHQLNEQFARAYHARGENARKTVFFFVSAARDADMVLSSYLFENSRVRGDPAGKRMRASKRASKVGQHLADALPITAAVVSALAEKFPAFDPGWPDEIKHQWFESFRELMARLPNEPESGFDGTS